jgi:hypothetical protein
MTYMLWFFLNILLPNLNENMQPMLIVTTYYFKIFSSETTEPQRTLLGWFHSSQLQLIPYLHHTSSVLR